MDVLRPASPCWGSWLKPKSHRDPPGSAYEKGGLNWDDFYKQGQEEPTGVYWQC